MDVEKSPDSLKSNHSVAGNDVSEETFLLRQNEKLKVTGVKKSRLKLIVFIILSVFLFPLPLLIYFFAGYCKSHWRTMLLNSPCAIRDATVLLIHEKEEVTPAEVDRITIPEADLDNYFVDKLVNLSATTGHISIVKYKLDRYIIRDANIEPLGSLGEGESFRTLQDISVSENKARQTLTQIYGRNLLDVPLPPLITFVLSEILSFFYIFQLLSCILWFTQDYEIYATMIVVMSVISAASTTYVTRSGVVKLRKGVLFQCGVEVRQGASSQLVSSGDLVPGDIVKIPHDKQNFTFDGVLLAGNVVVDEAMLTGESVPTLKNPIPTERLEDAYHSDKNDVITVFSGTTVLQCRPPNTQTGDNHVYCLVTKIGFATKRGETVKFMLHPKKTQTFKFYSEAWTYVKIMAFIGIIGMTYKIYDAVKNDYDPGEAILNSLDLLTIIIAPSLPLALSISVFYAIRRLKAHRIRVALPNSINIAGKIKMTVFDKTGTLTEEGLTLHIALSADNAEFSKDAAHSEGVVPGNLRPVLGTCHSLSVIGDDICGDPMDIISQQASGFDFKDSGIEGGLFKTSQISAVNNDPLSGTSYGVVKTLPFESHLKRMSVVCEDSGGSIHVFTKGAPEQVITHCNPNTVPHDFLDKVSEYSSQGYRIIGLASKTCTQHDSTRNILDVAREDLESEMDFLGLLILANKLKPETSAVIEELVRADIRVLMCTGDNLLTAVCVARKCAIIPQQADVYIVTTSFGKDKSLQVQFDLQAESNGKMCMGISEKKSNFYSGPLRRVHLAMEGEAFSLILKYRADLMDKICVTGTIFARFSPEQKMLLIDELQQRSYSICMCGDGANDCEALRHANVGIALSKCDASLAAPFTSSVFNITCVPILLREGHCALENSMSVFRFTAMYSIIQFLSVMLLVPYSSVLGDFQYLFEDIGIVLMFDFAIAYTSPATSLSPVRPRGSLMHPFVIFSFFTQTALVIGFVQFVMWMVQQQPWYDPKDDLRAQCVAEDELCVPYFETTVNFWLTCWQFIIMALVFSIGRPHRLPVYTNIPMIVSTLLSFLLVLLIIFLPSTLMTGMELADISSNSFKFGIFGLALGNFILALGVEYSYRVLTPLQWFLKLFRCKKGHKNIFKHIIDALDDLGGTWPQNLETQSETQQL